MPFCQSASLYSAAAAFTAAAAAAICRVAAAVLVVLNKILEAGPALQDASCICCRILGVQNMHLQKSRKFNGVIIR